jgi:hypothetical protein
MDISQDPKFYMWNLGSQVSIIQVRQDIIYIVLSIDYKSYTNPESFGSIAGVLRSNDTVISKSFSRLLYLI